MNYNLIQKQFLASTYPSRGLTIVRGEGAYLIDDKGERYLDMLGGSYGVGILGYGIPEIIKSIQLQVETLIPLHSSFINDKRSQATLHLIKRIKNSGFKSLQRVFWSNSGTEAVEAALKFAVLATGKTRIIAAKNGYHGKTLGSLAVNNSGNGKYQKPFKKMLTAVDTVEFGDITFLEKTISSKHAAVILEPIQGEGGVIIPPIDYFPLVSELCRRYGVLLIIDEIQTGVGRTGTFLNSEQYIASGFSPDIICMGKGLGYGLPVGATIITNQINEALSSGIHTNTFGGNPLSMAAVDATLTYFDDHPELLDNVKISSTLFEKKLLKLQKEYPLIITEISSAGFMIGIELAVDPIEVLKALQEQKIIAAPTSVNRIRLLPPLLVTDEELERVVLTLNKICKGISK
ncbi:aspartate aminotransferase family protein [Candidatus Roizmanbacteria bacterium CG_4_9_14_0_2_um_filter_39_13]|uniref:Aspartate aminotransferase family protein n=2 Tax=Candidatus Roizmaniibacteriota TaxID=1752723 RepID=A0A2M8EW60_9BACT|nr:MAG: aspartate aminotransferase family protein [Candidatus Roizmanbacteria bacterium CG_4_10_14_0_2_um_filter_39_12]PJC30108.1 MAG: aspartate aminotransferase family protein [Candidatus Roizmanbacteria bacterium CG_4_9_14_0_2_um_filter_39_13]PJE61547.1 MAG: aspartate aminotransferase family protein [Candidatus Roizmanbacteria bacterium CG10_big_fil_rev_8_21_14_0_10_39_12]